jgi:RNA polymerase sigma-70 factor (ECF subfamily)
LYDRFARRAFGLAYRVLGDGAAAEDAVQEAFLTLWNQSDRLDGRRGRVESLLMTIVHRRAVDIVRSRRGRTAYAVPLDFDMVDEHAADIVDAVADRVTYDSVRVALAGLAPEQRRTIELSYFEGLTHSEIAETTATPLGTVKSRLRLGLERLRTELGIEKAQ